MKTILFALLAFFAVQAQAKSILRKRIPYEIVSDTPANDVPAGFCKVSGMVSSNGLPINYGLVANYNMTHHTNTDSLGHYSFLIPEKDSIIFFFILAKAEIVIQPYDFKSKHHVIIHFFPEDNVEMMIVDKPVIYCYSNESIQVDLQLTVRGNTLFTYPEYHAGWNMEIDQNGMRDAITHKTYPYLFWEGEMPQLNYLTDNDVLIGTYLKTDSVVSFLENQLTFLGLNRTEQTDFITFWAPRMQSRTYVFVQFLVDDQYAAKVAELNVSPKPDAMRRVYMLFSGFETDQRINTSPQVFENFNRKGFTILEWGGSEVNNKLVKIEL